MATDVASTIIKLVIVIVKWKNEYTDSQNALGTLAPTIELVRQVVSGII